MDVKQFQLEKMKEIVPELLHNYDLTMDELEGIVNNWYEYGVRKASELWDWVMMGYSNPIEVKQLKEKGFSELTIAYYLDDYFKEVKSQPIEFKLVEFGKDVSLEFLWIHPTFRQQGYGTFF